MANANVKFFKGTCQPTTDYIAGGIYFDSSTREIRLGKGGVGAYDAYGNGIKDAVLAENKLTISFHDTTKSDIVLDFSDIASAKVTMAVFGKLDERLKALETAAPKAGNDIKIGDGSEQDKTSINVALSEEITVAGLNDTYGCGLIKNGNTIPAGTSLTEILKQMLSKELNPNASTKPSISISKAGPASGLHEVGETINVGTATISKTAGYFNNNGWASPTQPAATFSWSNEKMSSKLTNGAEGYTTQTDVASIAQGTAKTVKGTNKVTITASADYSAPTNKPITNLNKPYDGADATWVAGTATNTTTVEWIGVYPCFTNLGNLGAEPTVKCALQTGATFSFTVPAHNAGNNDFRFAYPDGWTISSFKVKSLDGKYYEYAAAHNKNAGDLIKTIQGVKVTYHYLTVANGASDYQITLDKGLNA